MSNKLLADCCHQTRDQTVEQAIFLCSKRPGYIDIKATWMGWVYSSDVKHLPSICEILALIPSTIQEKAKWNISGKDQVFEVKENTSWCPADGKTHIPKANVREVCCSIRTKTQQISIQ